MGFSSRVIVYFGFFYKVVLGGGLCLCEGFFLVLFIFWSWMCMVLGCWDIVGVEYYFWFLFMNVGVFFLCVIIEMFLDFVSVFLG